MSALFDVYARRPGGEWEPVTVEVEHDDAVIVAEEEAEEPGVEVAVVATGEDPGMVVGTEAP